MKYFILVFTIIFFGILSSCGNDIIYVPKPRMYPKIHFPERAYVNFEESYCKMTFNYPKYAEIVQDNYFFDGKPADPCWFNINYKTFDGTLYCSYIPIIDRKHYDKLINESFKLVEEHNQKANFRKEEYVVNKNGVGGMYFYLSGEVATNLQFILTDTTSNFFRASLYFNSKVAQDSLKPIYNFVREDVDQMIESFKWVK